MALGTNYARTPSMKAMNAHWLNCAKRAIKTGKTKEDFLRQFKDFAKPKMAAAYDLAAEKLDTRP